MQVTDAGSLNLLSRSCAEYNINELGLQKRSSLPSDALDGEGLREKTYQCASHEMCVFGAIGWGASSVVRKAIHIPTHRILALKKINIFEKVVTQQATSERNNSLHFSRMAELWVGSPGVINFVLCTACRR